MVTNATVGHNSGYGARVTSDTCRCLNRQHEVSRLSSLFTDIGVSTAGGLLVGIQQVNKYSYNMNYTICHALISI